MTTTHTQTHTHPSPLTTLAPHLLPHLPHSLPLLRRIQFHTSSPSARAIATFPPSPSPPPSAFAATWADRTRAPLTECWIFSTYETLPPLPPLPNTSLHQQQQQQQRQEEEEEAKEAAKSHCLALLAAIARSSPSPPPPPSAKTSLMVIGSLNERLLGIIGGEEAVRRVVPQDVVAREIPIASADERGSGREREREEGADKREKRRGDVILSVSVPICKWLIGPVGKGRGRGGEEGEGEEEESSSDVATSLLPAGYTFHDSLSAADLRLTISRTAIPKTVDALAQLGCVGVRYSCQEHTPSPPPSTIPNQQTSLIAWAFLSHDGSLSTLHVEPPHRRQGLAKAMSRRLLQRLGSDASGVGFRAVVEADGMERAGRGVVGDDDDDGDGDEVVGAGYGYGAGEGWAHSDVAEGNVESAGVARGIGGREGWRVRWVGVDLGAVGGEVGWGGC